MLFKGEDARYIPTGHVIYALDTTLFAAPFDAAARRVTGRGLPVVEGVRREVFVAGNTSTANYGVTDDGTLVYVHGPAESEPVILRDLVLVDHQGVARAITDQRRDYWRPLISPDGTRVAVEVFDGNAARHIWVVNVATGVSTQITFTGFLNDFLAWTPDGNSLVFASTVEGARRLFRKHVEGGDAEALGVTGVAVPTDVSRDGTLLYSMGDQTAERAIWTLSLSVRKPVEILATPAQEHHAKVLARRALAGVRVERIGAAGDLRPTVSDRGRHGEASLGGRWRRAGVGAGRVGALLSRSASADERPDPARTGLRAGAASHLVFT